MKKKNSAQEKPQCRYHQNTMVLHTSHRSFSGTSHYNGYKEHNFWRCGISGCPWVAASQEQEPEPVWEKMSQGREYMRHL